MLSVQCAEFLRHSQLACKSTLAGLSLPTRRTHPTPWHRQSRGFDTPFSMRLLSPRIKYPLLIFLAFACNELRVSFPQGTGMQHTGVTGSPAVARLGQTRRRQQLLARRDPGSSCTTQFTLWSRSWSSSAPGQRCRGCLAPPSPCQVQGEKLRSHG